MKLKEECNSLSDGQLIKKIAEDSEYLSCVYYKTKEYCIKFMQKQCNGVDIDEIRDIYHEAVLVLYDKAKSADFVLTCTIQTYLNSICRNQLLKKFKDDGKIISFPETESNDDNPEYIAGIKDWLPPSDISINGEDESEARIKAIMKGLAIMKGKKGDCYELLTLVYWQKKTMLQIAAYFGYKSEQIARNKSYLCREKLKGISFDNLHDL
jgi:RNA polymerase sigma factor (sigma-70 family)